MQTVNNKLITLVLPSAFSWHIGTGNLFVESMCILFNGAASRSDCVASNGRMVE